MDKLCFSDLNICTYPFEPRGDEVDCHVTEAARQRLTVDTDPNCGPPIDSALLSRRALSETRG